MPKILVSTLSAAILSGLSLIPAGLAARGVQGTPASTATNAAPPDFSGVYYPVQQGRGGQGQRAGAPPAGAPRGGPPSRVVLRLLHSDHVRTALGRLPGTVAGRSVAQARVHGEVGNDAEIAHGRILRVR